MNMIYIQKRSVATCLILSIVTCGIYGIYWYYTILKDLYMANGVPNTAGTDILLSIVTCGIYSIYMAYRKGKLVASARARFELPYKDDSVLYLVLSLLGFGIVADCIVQSEINDNLADIVNTTYNNNIQ